MGTIRFLVIPGRGHAANPEPITTMAQNKALQELSIILQSQCLWVPGSAARPRNDKYFTVAA
jgi:hypothetical protein